jgi:hypothetical protein
MQVNNVRERIPSAEPVFFKKNLSLEDRASNLVSYAKIVGKLPSEMVAVIAQVPAFCVQYAHLMSAEDVPEEIIDGCSADQGWIVRMAGVLGKRILHLEHKIVSPEHYVEYASGVRCRVPEMEDRILFCEDGADIHHRAFAAFKLIEKTIGNGYGRPINNEILEDQKLKDLMKKDRAVVAGLMEYLGRRSCKLPAEFHHVFAGSGEYLSKLSEHLRSRLSPELERTWEGGKRELVNYAVRWVRGPLPEGMEDVLIGDPKAIADYAFQVVRGFASPRLSDTLHNCLLISEQTEDVKRYIAECDRVEEMKRLIEAGIEMAG